MHAFSQVLQLIRLRAEIYYDATQCGVWSLDNPPSGLTCFHLLMHGQCMLEIPQVFSGSLSQGDLVIFPYEMAHTLQSITPDDTTSVMCGHIFFAHQASHTVLQALPSFLHLKSHETQAWLPPLQQLIDYEKTIRPTHSKPMIERLSELLFLHVLQHVMADSTSLSGVLALYAHPKLRHAIERIHEQVQFSATLEQLAEIAGMSRTSFCQRFKQVSGLTPFEYQTWWRMQLAWQYLQAGETVQIVADKVGYASEAAFSRSFKRQFGVAAGTVRGKILA